MKNSDFRSLLSSTTSRRDDENAASKPPTTTGGALGAKKSSFVPMTPRPGKMPATNDDFARQMRERHAALQPTKKQKSTAPKGSRFAKGYTDRAKARQEGDGDDDDDKAKRIAALEEQVKLGQLSSETFEALRDEITGGQVSSTHLVKGLDRKLLERVQRGEDVLGLSSNGGGGKEAGEVTHSVDVDEELNKLEGQEIKTAKRERAEKKGTMAPPPLAGRKRSRNEIMAELKAQRKAAAEAKAASAPVLDGRWRKVGEQAKPKTEIDHKGREVMTIVNQDGTIKKMVKKAPANMPDTSRPVLGADVAVPEPKKPDGEDDVDDNDDIFAGVGTEYNPLGDGDDDDDDYSSESDDNADEPPPPTSKHDPNPQEDKDSSATNPKTNPPLPPAPIASTIPRNYFTTPTTDSATSSSKEIHFQGIESVLKKAAKLRAARANGDASDDENENDDEYDDTGQSKEELAARRAKRARMLDSQDRDREDMDLGFGGSRGEDDEDEDDDGGGGGGKIRLSEWKGGVAADDEDDGDGGGGGGRKKKKKQRKPKKRKGDVNNVADIFRVIEGRKAGGGGG